MKKLALLLIGLIGLSSTTFASETEATLRNRSIYDGSKYVFVENGIEFSVFPDGEFDFYIPEYVDGISLDVSAGPIGISFNTGFNYDPYVQYDDYGAVVQIENTPLFYDYYGRLSQAGDVRINYRNNRISRVGGLYVHYNNYGVFSHSTGYINIYNRYYVYRPFHSYFYRPIFNRCLVWTTPYRRYYAPVRYNYAFHRNNYYRGYNNGYRNARRDFRRPDRGRVAHNNGRRDNVDRNNARFRRTEGTSARRSVATNRARSERKETSTASRGGRNGSNRGYISNEKSDHRIAQNRENARPSNARPSRGGTTAKGAPTVSRRGTTDRKRKATTRPSTRPSASTRPSSSRKGTARPVERKQSRKAERPSNTQRRATAPRTQRKASPARSTQRSSAPKRTNRSSSSRSSKSTNRNSSRSRRG